MQLKDYSIQNLITKIPNTYEEFDENAHQYNEFINRIRTASGKETVNLRYVDRYGLCQYILLEKDYALISAEAELTYDEILDIEELRNYPKGIIKLINDYICGLEIDNCESLENRFIFTYEMIVPSDPDIILSQLKRVEIYANLLRSQELVDLQKNIKKLLE